MSGRYTPLEYLLKNMQNSKAELLQGTLDLLILKTLNLGSLHGYAIVQSIQRCSDEILAVEEGSLYPALHRMEEKGWIAAEWGRSDNNRRAKFYSLTRAGRKQLEEETAIWERICHAITLVLNAA
jgi:PadR family transcriptional regulator, regulatory protein PadR